MTEYLYAVDAITGNRRVIVTEEPIEDLILSIEDMRVNPFIAVTYVLIDGRTDVAGLLNVSGIESFCLTTREEIETARKKYADMNDPGRDITPAMSMEEIRRVLGGDQQGGTA